MDVWCVCKRVCMCCLHSFLKKHTVWQSLWNQMDTVSNSRSITLQLCDFILIT